MTLSPSSASNATSANQQGQKREDHDLLSLRFKVNRFGDEKTIQKSVSARTTIAQLRDDFLFDQGKDGSAQEAIETARSTMKIRFFHAGKYLAEDGCSLEQYSIRDDTCLHVFITKNLAATAASSSGSAAAAQPAGARTIQVGGQVFQISGDENPAEDPGSRHWFLEGILPVLQRSASGNLFGGTSSRSAEAGAGASVEGPPEQGAGRASSSTTRPQTANNSARDGDGTRQADGDDGDIEQGRRPPGRGSRPSDQGTTAGEQAPPQPLTDAQRAHLEMQQRILNFFGVATTPLLPGGGGGTTTGAGGATSSTAAAPTVAGRPHLLRTPDQELISTSAAVVPAGARTNRLGAGEGGVGVPRPQAMTWRHFAQQLNTNGDAPNGEIPEECRLGYHRDMVLIWPTLPGVMCGLCFYPYGMCCCLLHKIRRCPHCGYTVHSC